MSRVRLEGAPLRLLKASEDNFDDLFRELQMADIASASGAGARDGLVGTHRDVADAALEKLVRLAGIARKELTDLRVQARQAIREAVWRGDQVVNVDLHVDSLPMAAFGVLDDLVKGAAEAARSGYLLTEPPGGEVVAFRLWAREEIVRQMAGEPATSCPFPVAADESQSTK